MPFKVNKQDARMLLLLGVVLVAFLIWYLVTR